MEVVYDDTDDACRCEWRSECPKEECDWAKLWTTNNSTNGEMDHVSIRDEIRPTEELKETITIGEAQSQHLDHSVAAWVSHFILGHQEVPDTQSQQQHAREAHDDHAEQARGRVGDGSIWNHNGQHYFVKEWQKSDNAQLACFTKGQQGRRPVGAKRDEYEDDEENENMMCQMTGEQWESLPFPTIVVSGACISVMPSRWCQHVPVEETKESNSGEFFRAANGEKIYTEGRKVVSLMTRMWNSRRVR